MQQVRQPSFLLVNEEWSIHPKDLVATKREKTSHLSGPQTPRLADAPQSHSCYTVGRK